MNYNDLDEVPFMFRYLQIKAGLSEETRTFIETMFMFNKENSNLEDKPKRITKDKILDELMEIKKAINSKDDSESYNNIYKALEYKVSNNKEYFDLLIKLECALGIYPNMLFQHRSRQIFYDKVYFPVLEGTFNENSLFDKKTTFDFYNESEDDSLDDEVKKYVKTRVQ